MRIARRRLLALAATIGAALTILIPSAASAAYYGSETDYAVSSGAPSGTYECAYHTGVTACFKPNGDRIYVKDTKADGYAAVAHWHMLGFEPRTGSCVNKLEAGHWGSCNKNFAEQRDLILTPARYNSGNFVDWGPNERIPTS